MADQIYTIGILQGSTVEHIHVRARSVEHVSGGWAIAGEKETMLVSEAAFLFALPDGMDPNHPQ
jgi:hypothetical protein